MSLEDGVHGDQVPPNLLEVIDALFHLRIPGKWLQLAGETSAPGSWSLGVWLADLQSRHAHIDRVLTQVSYCWSKLQKAPYNFLKITKCKFKIQVSSIPLIPL